MLYQAIIVIHILLGLSIIGLVLIQQGKGADAGAAFGSGASGSVFGAQGSATFLSRATAIFATLFFTTSMGLAFLSGHHEKKVDIIDAISAEPVKQEAPAAFNQDVPLTQSGNAENEPVEKLPEAQVPEAPAEKVVAEEPAAVSATAAPVAAEQQTAPAAAVSAENTAPTESAKKTATPPKVAEKAPSTTHHKHHKARKTKTD